MATTNLSDYDKSTIPNAENLKFGIVVSEWNSSITENLYQGAVDTLLDNGASKNNITRLNVPGSFELVYGSKHLLKQRQFDAIIAIGCVIQGETKHFDFVCEAVSQGIKDLNIQFDIPTIFCVLTDNTMQQSIDRSGGKHGNKGVECAVAAIKMATLA
ncbi:6,7-dimethyl-8-ribityllumazine synthase [Aureibaculum sp. 2210JD6-5]|uniref:6,7-dimethyl-8-ribityllumazine synthase n=1 Tax=Aureibaculum sp. 2210JD6-5 TaxID=3103957 RepID=UPI002AAE6A18|nr:6,7-dimethyl-8-ribityllumazine synthase [Aureibaculum sp. 2210JD6-5]MDY7395185.1 6,7-dimethyl-8-ribityllumazine synthase [Aureibaculum sp. 2210JD6-5]